MVSIPTISSQIDRETMEAVTDFIFLGSKIIADSDCSPEIQRCLLLGKKFITNIDSVLKSKDIALPTKVQFSSVAQSCPTLCSHMNPAHQASLSIINSRSSLRLTSIESMMPSRYLILGRPLFLLPTIPPSIRVFSKESTLRMRWPKYWSFSFSIIPSKEIPGLISFRMDWFDLLAVQGTLKSLLQHHSSKASILQRSAFFTVQLSHPYMTTGKTIALTRRTLVDKVMSLLFNMPYIYYIIY